MPEPGQLDGTGIPDRTGAKRRKSARTRVLRQWFIDERCAWVC
jgi:hypothetical protein